MTADYAVHSDLLVHWTGKDIDNSHQPQWFDSHYSKTEPEVVADQYLQRFNDILTHGLWMTEEKEQTYQVGTTPIDIPPIPKCCFTELKLSESRSHAKRYGRLGIGLKRKFLFDRFGRPLAYFGFGQASSNDKFLETCARELRDHRLLNFFKPMNSRRHPLDYDLYSESEWRILLFDELLKKQLIIDPRDSNNVAAHAYFNALPVDSQTRLKYLIPLDGWFALVIYPSLEVKNRAQWDSANRARIKGIKTVDDQGNRVERLRKPLTPLRGNWPVEVDLDACRNF